MAYSMKEDIVRDYAKDHKQYDFLDSKDISSRLISQLRQNPNYVPFESDMEHERRSDHKRKLPPMQYGNRAFILQEVQRVNNHPIPSNRITLTDIWYYRVNNLIFPFVLRARITKDVLQISNRLRIPLNQEFKSYFRRFGFESDHNLQNGHILADSLGGPNAYWNFFPQSKRSNLGTYWRSLEMEILKWVKDFKNGDYIDWSAWVGHSFPVVDSALVGTIKIAAIWRTRNGQVEKAKELMFDFQQHPVFDVDENDELLYKQKKVY